MKLANVITMSLLVAAFDAVGTPAPPSGEHPTKVILVGWVSDSKVFERSGTVDLITVTGTTVYTPQVGDDDARLAVVQYSHHATEKGYVCIVPSDWEFYQTDTGTYKRLPLGLALNDSSMKTTDDSGEYCTTDALASAKGTLTISARGTMTASGQYAVRGYIVAYSN